MQHFKPKEKKSIDTINTTLQKINVHFVETNRLYRQLQASANWKTTKEPQSISSVRDCAKQLITHISTALKDYGKKSQELDQSFPHRFIYEPANPMELDELKVRLFELTKQLKNLRTLGILDTEGNQPFDTEGLDTVEPYKLEIMNLYVRDSEKKLAAFDFLSRRTQLLLESLSEKFNNKKILLSKEKGLIAEGPKNLDIDLESLSSGEQHEIVLLYELLFKVPKNTLVLIDEPELSLHVTWQKAFLPELISIASEVGFFSIVATHSPYIVGDRYDLMTALESENNDE
jgi:predicted ATP-dependent endonuclease of OLD family